MKMLLHEASGCCTTNEPPSPWKILAQSDAIPIDIQAFDHSMPHISSVQLFFIFTGRPLTLGIDLIKLCSTISLFRPRTRSLGNAPPLRAMGAKFGAMGDFAPTPQSYGGILRPPLRAMGDFAPTPGILPPPLIFCPHLSEPWGIMPPTRLSYGGFCPNDPHPTDCRGPGGSNSQA